tara:strand:+ start:34371 stop:34739 length:369 start_codon:yes stop_codon:yes gene_type:complete
MKRFLSAAIVGASLSVFATPTLADDPAHDQCAGAFDLCLKECDTKYEGDVAGRAACVPSCSGRYAACDAGVAYDKAKPWVEEQAKKTKKFLEDLMQDLKKAAPGDSSPETQPDAPQNPTKSI